MVRASAGTLNIGDGIDEKFMAANGADIIIDGGTINVSGRFSYNNVADAITFNMSSGTVNAATVGSTTTNVPPFTIINTASSFTMSGGTIVIMKGGGMNSGYSNFAATSSVTGGTLQIGSTSTLATDTIEIISTPPIWNLTINSTNAPVAQLTAALVIYNDLTISGGKLLSNNFNLTVGGDWINNGAFVTGTETVTFNGTTAMSGTAVTNTFNNLTVAASSTVTSSTGITGLVVNGVLTTGASATLDLGTTTVLSGTLGTISNSGTIITSVPTTISATPIPSGKTWGGTIDYANASANQTVVGGTYNNLTVRPGNSRVATASGNLVVNGTLTVTTAFGAFDMSTYVLSGTLTSIVNNGDIRTSNTSAAPIPAGKTWGGTIYYNATTGAQTVMGGTYNIIRFSNTSGTNTASGDLTVNNQFVTAAGGTLNMGSSYRIINMGSTITNDGTVKTSVPTTTSATPFPAGKTWGGTGTVEYAATSGAQTVMSGTYNNLRLSNTSGNNIISGNVALNAVLTLTGGTVTTSTYSISLNSAATVSRTSGHVVGNFKKHVATGATSKTFEVGDATNYTPLTVAFASVTTAEYLTVSVTATDHPNLAGSGIRTDKSVNRYFVLTNQGIVFTTATLTFNWVAGDIDAGSTTASFVVGNYNGSAWSLPAVASPLATSVQATGVTALGSFAVGMACTVSSSFSYTGSPYCANGGSATPTITGSPGTFTSTAGLSINASTGVVDLAASTAGTYTITNTSLGGCSSSATSNITISPLPTTAAAGADQTSAATCGLTTVTLAGNSASIGTGAWSIVSGTGGTITTPSSATSTFTGTAGNTYTLRWTISNSPCTASTDDVIITFNRNPTISAAGADQTGAATCGLTTVTLAGNFASVGTGAWSIVSGTGGIVTTPSSATSTFTGTAGSTYTLRWTISNSPCTASTDDVVITFNRNPTTSAAGADQTGAATCGLTTVTLAANAASIGTGAWSIVSGTGGTVTTPSSATSTFTGIAGSSYTLRWTISNSPCTASTDDVVITFNRNPTTAAAGADQTGTATCGLTTVTLAGNTPSIGTGAWSIVSGTGGTVTTPSSATSTFTGTAGSSYTLRWTISNSPCTASTDDVVITFNNNPTTSAAGADQTGVSTCGLTTVTLAANAASVGTGAWSIVSGTGGTVTTPSSATSTFTGTAGTAYVLRWTISNSPCIASTDDVNITFNQTPTTSNAGADQTSAATCGLTTITLAANAASIGTGAWSIVSGSGGIVTTPSSATSTFTGTAGTAYVLRWTISNSPCTASTDDVNITFNRNPTTAAAGADQTGAATCGLTTVTLAGNTPSIGTGAWSIVSGTGGTVTTPSSATSTFTGTAGTAYVLRWTISNSPCTVSTDDVNITFNISPTTSAAGADQTGVSTCGLTTVTLAANAASVGTGAWSIGSGTGGTITTPSSATSTFTGTAGTSYTLRWTISNTPCTASSDDVVIAFNQYIGNNSLNYTVNTNGVLCATPDENGTATLTAPAGSVFTTVGFASYGTPTGTCSAFVTGNCNASTSQAVAESYLLGNNTASIPATNGMFGDPCSGTPKRLYVQATYSQPICSGTSPGTISGTTPTGGTGSYTYLWEVSTTSSSTGFATAAGTNNAKDYTAGTLTQTTWYRRTVTSGVCTSVSAVIQVTVTAAPSATINYSGSPYCSSAGTATVTRTGTAGGTYTSTAGLVIDASTGAITLASSAGGTYTVTYTVAASGGCAQYTTTTSITITLNGTWTGAASTNWNTAGNWVCSTIPVSTTNVIIPGSLSNYPVISSGTNPVNNLSIQSGASLTVTGATLQIAGAVTNSGTFTANNGTIVMNGSSAQTIPASTFAGNVIKSLTVNNTSGVTLGGALSLTDALTISGGSLTTGGYLTLKSTATATARVAQITSATGTPISGNVTVERYIPGRRRYRLITSCVTTSTNATLIAGQEALSIWGNWQNQGNNVIGNTGTIITGGSSGDGFDQQTANASLFTYDDVNRTYVRYNTANGKNTKYTPLKAGIAYYMFVYGDRLNTVSTANPNNTVIKATGTLLTGDQTYNTSSTIPLSNVTDRYTMLGNPFASPVDWGSVQRTNLSGTYWGWDPNMSSTGGYVTVSTAGSVTIVAPFSGTTGLNQYIQPGQGFFVKTTAASPTLVIREQDKVGNFNANAFRNGGTTANSIPLMAINLQYPNGPDKILADGVVAAFDDSFTNAVNDEDGSKMGNSITTESIGIVEGANMLSIDARQTPKNKDTLFLNMAKLTKPQYTLEIFTQQMEGYTARPYLEDAYLNTSVPLSLTDTNRITFTVTAGNTASSAVDRFKIVFKQMDVLPVTFTSIQATVNNKSIHVDWNVAQEQGIKRYEVERSADGMSFTRVAEVNAKGNNSAESYQWIDITPGNGANYYRIRAIQQDGKMNLTKIVLAKIEKNGNGKLVLFPNPVQNQQIKFQLKAIATGQYTLQLYSSRGQILLNRIFDHNTEVTNHLIQPDRKLVRGMYYLQITNNKEQYHQTLLIE